MARQLHRCLRVLKKHEEHEQVVRIRKKIIYLLITIQLQIIFYIIDELSNFGHVLGVVSQTKEYGVNRNYGPHSNSLALL